MAIYICRPNLEKLPKESKPRLIRAKTKAGALAFAVSDFYTAEPADAENVLALESGTKVEEAK